MGDSTNMVIILAGELLKKSENLLVMGLHPSEVIKGYELACAKALAELESESLPLFTLSSDNSTGLSTSSLPSPFTRESLITALKPVIASKQYGYEDTLSSLVAEAALVVMPKNPKNFNVDNVRVVKIMGGSLSGSKVVQGMVFGREPEGNYTQILNTVLTLSRPPKVSSKKFQARKWPSSHVPSMSPKPKRKALSSSKAQTKCSILRAARNNNLKGYVFLHLITFYIYSLLLKQIFKEIADSGIKVIIAGSSIGDLALHYLNRFNIAVLKVLSKFDLRRVARVVNATPLARVGAPTAEEAGYVDIFETTEIGGDRVTVLRQLASGEDGYQGHTEKTRTATIVLRGATANHLDDLERAIDDGVNVIKSLIKDPRLVPGAGATELELGKRVEAYGSGMRGLAQHAVKRYATALEVIPRTLAENALGGAEGNEVLSRLWAKHEQEGGEAWGVDIEVKFASSVSSSFD